MVRGRDEVVVWWFFLIHSDKCMGKICRCTGSYRNGSRGKDLRICIEQASKSWSGYEKRGKGQDKMGMELGTFVHSCIVRRNATERREEPHATKLAWCTRHAWEKSTVVILGGNHDCLAGEESCQTEPHPQQRTHRTGFQAVSANGEKTPTQSWEESHVTANDLVLGIQCERTGDTSIYLSTYNTRHVPCTHTRPCTCGDLTTSDRSNPSRGNCTGEEIFADPANRLRWTISTGGTWIWFGLGRRGVGSKG